MQSGEDLSMDELVSNLSTYKQQLNQVKKLLADDPGNSEYVDMEKELEEAPQNLCCITTEELRWGVITLTEELLATAKQTELSGLLAKDDDGIPSYDGSSSGMHTFELGPDELSDFHKFSVGMRVQAVWSEDGEWYDATIEALTPIGYYVAYDGWGNKEEVDPDNVRPIEAGAMDSLRNAEREAEATRLAIKRKIAQAAEVDFESRTLPAKLRIDPNDPDDVKAAKRKKIHAFKSKVRQEQLEVAQNKRQNAWQQFQTTKGKSKKVGFFSGRKRESIFKSPEDPQGKVGVTGSGKGLTEFLKREKHLHLKGGGIGGIEE